MLNNIEMVHSYNSIHITLRSYRLYCYARSRLCLHKQ